VLFGVVCDLCGADLFFQFVCLLLPLFFFFFLDTPFLRL